MLLVLYKDAFAVGYTWLYARVKKWLQSSSRTLCHNTQLLQTCFKEWGKTKVELGKLKSWERKAASLALKGVVMKGSLWMDSFDAHLKGKSTVSHKSPSWLFKCNSPTQQFMVLQDAEGVVCTLWGGYSPKVFNGDFLKMNQDWIKQSLA
ncbi:uncharacterized protein ACA1_307930, partial [Acanthamoeba castellanii str. Neff]